MMNKPGFALLFSELRKTLRAKRSRADINCAEPAQKPSALVAWCQRPISPMKEANRFRSLRYLDLRSGARIVLKRRKDERRHFRVARRALKILTAPSL
jgi:hypothetical protein